MDAVYIATPPYLHPEHFEAAVTSRKHIFMEKPAGVDPAGCSACSQRAEEADKRSASPSTTSSATARITARRYDIVKSGELGAIKHDPRGLDRRRPARARGTCRRARRRCATGCSIARTRGDIIVEQNCHNLDVVNWFMGTHPVKACGYGGRQVRTDIGNIMDNLAATFQFADGVIFSYSADQFAAGGFTGRLRDLHLREGRDHTSRAGLQAVRQEANAAQPPVEVVTQRRHHRGRRERVRGRRAHGKLENAAFTAAESTLDRDHGARGDLQRQRDDLGPDR